MAITARQNLEQVAARLGNSPAASTTIRVGHATCENAAGSRAVEEAFHQQIRITGRSDIRIAQVGCSGRCHIEPIVGIGRGSAEPVLYQQVTPDAARTIFEQHVLGGQPVSPFLLDAETDRAFQAGQHRRVLRLCGQIDPNNLRDYLQAGGFAALAEVLDAADPAAVIRTISDSGLRGRSGSGYPTGQKWANAAAAAAAAKYVLCNADEGDPGAFMDRGMLESDPFSVLEGLLLAGWAIGAQRGFVFVRAEYPLAVGRVESAVQALRDARLLGDRVLGTDWTFDVEIRRGAGAFVCGEETALLRTLEGDRAEPTIRPPYPTEAGLWGCPTVVNNVETLANVPWILAHGPEAFSAVGTEASPGTKVLALAGACRRTGLVEVPMGTTLRQVLFAIGGGLVDGSVFKAVHVGGSAGGCLGEAWLDTPLDFDSFQPAGAILGSGGLIGLDSGTCMVDLARYFLRFSQAESCGKCTPCREGTMRMLEILERLTAGVGREQDLESLERLGNLLRKASLCGLGRTAANPVLSTVRHFRFEYEAHQAGTCPAGACTLIGERP